MHEFDNKIAVITGAGSGIGQALAQALADAGAVVVATDRNPEGLEATRQLLGHDRHVFRRLDVTDRKAQFALAADLRTQFGGVDLLFNNAGVALSQTVECLDIEDFQWLMDINFWGVVHGTQAFLPDMLARRTGTIVNISSLFGLIGVPTQSAYNASKFAVRGFTESLRMELRGTGVRAICVHPGGIKTRIAENARFYVGPDGSSDGIKAARDFDRIARTTPAQAAARILKAVRKGEGRVLVGPDAQFLDLVQRMLPEDYGFWVKKALDLAGR